MDSKIGLDSIQINFFDNSPLALITTLYNYHTYDEILEMLFVLSKRIPDISFLNSRSPKDLKYWIQLYSEEVEKINHSTKS